MVRNCQSAIVVSAVVLGLLWCDSNHPRHAWGEASESDKRIVAKWEREMRYDLGVVNNSLVYQNGKMIREWFISDADTIGELQLDEVIERAAEHPAERRFAFDEGRRSEYFTLSEAGVVKYFSWDGKQFATMETTFMDPEVMTIGSHVQAVACVPTRLSVAAIEAVQLHRELHAFKDAPEFAEMGFSSAGPFHVWLKRIQTLVGRLDSDATVEAMVQLGISVADVHMLGMDYMFFATGARRGSSPDADDLQHVEDLERTLRASLALAFCQ